MIKNTNLIEKVKIEALSHDGRGIAVIGNKKTFVQGGLPGEHALLKMTQKHPHFDEALAYDITHPSSDRTEPVCPHFGICGGCSLQHMSLALQLEMKQQALKQQLEHFGKAIPKTWLPPLAGQAVHYRRKARLGTKFVIKKNKVLVGFREKKSRYLADLEQCAILHPRVGQHLPLLREVIRSLTIYQHIPQIEVAIGDHEVALIFRHLAPFSPEDLETLLRFAREHHIHLYLQPGNLSSTHKIYPQDGKERIHYTLPDEGLEFLFHPLDFTQINLEINRLMVKQALALFQLEPNDSVLDLFCGIGNFTLPIACYVKEVIGVEGSDAMVERAYENSKHNQKHNVTFVKADLFKPDPNAPWMKKNYDKILLDPPRAGAKEILAYVKHFNAKQIVYISCNPATLARDAGELIHEHGYQLQTVGMINMFPHTAHTEAIALFEKT